MAHLQIGLITSAGDLKEILKQTGYNMAKLPRGAEKVDILELVHSQLVYHLETKKRTQLKVSALMKMLEREGMDATRGCPRSAMVKVRELIAREGRRLG